MLSHVFKIDITPFEISILGNLTFPFVQKGAMKLQGNTLEEI